jgi:hypothetical protein
MTFVPVDFIVMDMSSNTSSHIILGRPFFRTTGVVIDSKKREYEVPIPTQKVYGALPKEEDNCSEVQVSS